MGLAMYKCNIFVINKEVSLTSNVSDMELETFPRGSPAESVFLALMLIISSTVGICYSFMCQCVIVSPCFTFYFEILFYLIPHILSSFLPSCVIACPP